MQLIAKKGVKIYRDFYIDMEITPVALPSVLKVPIVSVGEPVVWQKTVGDRIEKFEVIAVFNRDIPVYSPCSGILREIAIGPELGDVSGMQYAVIETKADDTPLSPMWRTDAADTKEGLLEILRKAAIVDETAKTFLYQIIGTDTDYQKLLIDCVDEQPYDLSRTAVLWNLQNEILGGAQLLMRAFGIPETEILLMKNFRTAALFRHGVEGARLIRVRGKYPAEPAIRQYTVKNNALRIGAQACRAVYRAAVFGEPQLSHVVTVWGEGVEKPAHFEVPNGMPVGDLLSLCDASGVLERVVGGGLMQGYTASLAWPLFPWDGALTAMPQKKHHKTVLCINCGRCAAVCPRGLAPYYMTRHSRKIGERRARELTAELCIGCGACAYICPARIPLKEMIRSYQTQGEGDKQA